MKIRFFSLLIVMTMIFNILPINVTASSASGEAGDGVRWSYDDGVITISGSGDMNDYYYLNKRPWYSYNDYIKEVVIEEGVTSVGQYCFSDCTNLDKITIADSVVRIEEFAFSGARLNKVIIPKGVKYISGSSFGTCEELESIEVDRDNPYFISFGGVLFSKDKSVLICYPTAKKGTEYYIQSEVEEIADYAFYKNDYLRFVSMTDNVHTMGHYSFGYCDELTEVKLSNSLVSMGQYSFYYCQKLTGIVIPDTLKVVPKASFLGCYNLTELKLGRRVETIDYSAFSECRMLENLYFPDSVKYIKDHAFSDTNIKSLHLGKNVLEIYNYAFGGCENLTEVIAGPNLRKLNGGFGDCTALTYVNLKDSVEFIGYSAFEGCTALTKINLTSPFLKEISVNAFAYCTNLQSVYLSKSIEKISASAFKKSNFSDPDVDIYYEGTEDDWHFVEIPSPYYLYDTNISFGCDMNRVHTVKFDTNGGEGSYSNREVAENAFMSAPKVPKRNGYTFAGWYANDKFIGEPFITKEGKVTRRVTRDITLYAKWEEKPGFKWEQDIFQFKNTSHFFGNNYYINDVYYYLLTKDINKIQQRTIANVAKKEFKGSCYGMVAVMMLAMTGDLNPSYFQDDADYVSQFSWPIKNNRIASLINYYFLSQHLPDYESKVLPMISPSTKSCAKQIVDALKIIDKTNNPVMINFKYYSDLEKKYMIHSVMGVAVEDDGKRYVVKIADPNDLLTNAGNDPITGEMMFDMAEPKNMYISYDYSKVDYSIVGDGKISTDDTFRFKSVVTYSDFFDDINLQRKLTGGDDGSSLKSNLFESAEPKTVVDVNYTDFGISSSEYSSVVTDGVGEGDLDLSEMLIGFDNDNYTFTIEGEDVYTISPAEDVSDSYVTAFTFDGEEKAYVHTYSEDKPVVTADPFGYVKVSSDTVCPKKISLTTENMPFDSIEISADVRELEFEKWDDVTFNVVADTSLAGAQVIVHNGLHETPVTSDAECTSFIITYNNYDEDTINIDTGEEFISGNMTYSVNFVTMGGPSVEGYMDIESGSTIYEPENTEYDGFIFGGWYKDADYTTKWDFDTDIVTENLYLYAKWEDDPSVYPVVTFNNYGEATQFVVKNGSSLSKDQYPTLAEEEGKITLWEDVDLSDIREDITVNAISVSKEEAVQVKYAEANHYSDTLLLDILFDLCVTDCVMVVDIWDEDENNVIMTETYDLSFNEKQKSVSIPYAADDKYLGISISFVDNMTDKNICGISTETYFYAERPVYVSGDYEYKLDGESAIISRYNGGDTYLTIPDTIEGHKVEAIGYGAFSDKYLDSVTLPKGLKTIGESAFYGNNFSEIKIPPAVEKIGNMAFAECRNLENIEPEYGNKSFCTIGGALYTADKTELVLYPVGKSGSDYVVADTTVKIYGGAFYNAAIESITIPKSVKYIGESAFAVCSNLKTVYYDGNEDEFNYEIDIESVNYYLEYAQLVCREATKPVYIFAVFANCEDNVMGVSVNFSRVEQDGVLCIAIYDGDRMVRVERLKHTVKDGTYQYAEIDFDGAREGYTVKAFYWADNSTLKPLSNVSATVSEA